MRILYFFLAFLLTNVANSFSQSQPIEIKGLLAGGYYSSPMQYGISCREYIIWLEITNITKESLVFDTVNIYWQCQGGTLPSKTVKTAEDSGASDPWNKKIKNFVLAPKEKQEFNFSTNGYTRDLIENQGGKPIYFVIIFVKESRLIAGPLMAKLPDLESMPIVLFLDPEKPQEGVSKLKFTFGFPQY